MSVSFAPRSLPWFAFAARVAAFEYTAIGSCCAGFKGVTLCATSAFK